MTKTQISKRLIFNVLKRFKSMSDSSKAHMVFIALEKPDWMKKVYPEVFDPPKDESLDLTEDVVQE